MNYLKTKIMRHCLLLNILLHLKYQHYIVKWYVNVLTLWLWQNSNALTTCHIIFFTLISSKPFGYRSKSSSTVWSTNSNTRNNRFFLLNTSIRFTKFSCLSCWKMEETQWVVECLEQMCGSKKGSVQMWELITIIVHLLQWMGVSVVWSSKQAPFTSGINSQCEHVILMYALPKLIFHYQ
jgi:hypothetical protein